MKVFLDTNVIFSAILFPNSMPDLAFQKALTYPYTAVTSDYCLEELQRKFLKKFPEKENALNAFFTTLIFSIQIVKTSNRYIEKEAAIRDKKDRPVLRAAIECGADILITGDKDFLESTIKKPQIITAIEFYNNFNY